MITWQELEQDPRFPELSIEGQDSLRHKWFKKNIEIDPRYKPELRDTLWYRIFKKPEIRPDITIAKSELAKIPGEDQILLDKWYKEYGKQLTKEEVQPEKSSLLKGIGYGLTELGKEQLKKLPETLLNLTPAGLSVSYLYKMLEDSKTAESRIKFWQQHTDAYG
ncbi:MAG: hypothetical protein H8D22_10790, partial [Candidatus Cloacimonetes bacterium]|nr:hypothetical protein [Candidatus Cloacimonadota bacterium]